MLLEFSILIFTIAFLLFTIFSILYLIQIRRTAKNIESILNILHQGLPGIMTKIDTIAGDISDTVQMIKMNASGLSNSSRKIESMVDDIVDFEKTLRKEIEFPIMNTLGTFNALLKGVRAFIGSLVSRP